MEGPQIRLKLLLDRLGISVDISTLQNRICIQKAIFLAKYAGADLGYSYSWYVHGPYSPELTSDYYVLENNLASGDSNYREYDLDPSLNAGVEKTKTIMMKPADVDLSKTEWLELVSSIIYWLNSTKNEADTKKILASEKKDLCKNTNYDRALTKIRECKILSL